MQIAPFSEMYQMSIGSMVFCLKDIIRQMPNLPQPNPTLQARIDTALASAQKANGMRFNWNVQERQVTKGRGGASETDNTIDKTLTATDKHLGALSRNGRRPRRQQMARELKSVFFPNGVRPLSGLSYEDQLAALEVMLQRIDDEFADHIVECGMVVLIDQLRDLVEQFAEDLDVRQRDEVTFDEVRAAEHIAREDFDHVLVTILADYRPQPEVRSALLAQVVDQQERIAAHMKRNGTIPNVDPNTGEVLDPDSGQPVEPPVADTDTDIDTDTDADPVDPPTEDDPVEA
ncbi:hypothetical protein FIV42_15690 [Persicimonas caeni]|uniref:Uncharacterized protein n=1 Tax=Persicimonas caeni TaxID=2292766 RepID=A0A4Y6PUX7_PERCE|nr:hypothetical protein [Persicimonas caeni]QDG52132.1 hypothetical protein FIV42_15690 [Persicimonas caeni]QED33354.1 hypothetical protein FRD00_15685 [Persicimonas caeni]